MLQKGILSGRKKQARAESAEAQSAALYTARGIMSRSLDFRVICIARLPGSFA